jgi:hypothetical protein
MLARAWPQPFSNQTKILIIPPSLTPIGEGIDLEPIRLPLREIVESIEQRVNKVVTIYQEKKRGRPVGWSQQMRQALTDVSVHLQEASDEQITQEIETYRARRRSRAQASARP